MKKYTFVVFTNPVEGQDDEYNEWYNERHVFDVIDVPGFVAVQRFQLADAVPQKFSHRYLALYEIETEDLKEVIRGLSKIAGTDAMFISESLDRQASLTAHFEPITERIVRETGSK